MITICGAFKMSENENMLLQLKRMESGYSKLICHLICGEKENH